MVVINFSFLLKRFITRRIRRRRRVELFSSLHLTNFRLLRHHEPCQPIILIMFFSNRQLRVRVTLRLFRRINILLTKRVSLQLCNVPQYGLNVHRSNNNGRYHVIIQVFTLRTISRHSCVSRIPAHRVINMHVIISKLVPFIKANCLNSFMASNIFLPFTPTYPRANNLHRGLNAAAM